MATKMRSVEQKRQPDSRTYKSIFVQAETKTFRSCFALGCSIIKTKCENIEMAGVHYLSPTP